MQDLNKNAHEGLLVVRLDTLSPTHKLSSSRADSGESSGASAGSEAGHSIASKPK